MAFAPTMPNTAKDVLNSMLIEFESDKTVNHLKENWFNASAPCIQQEERGEGAQLKFRDVWAFFFVYLMVGVFAIVGKIVQMLTLLQRQRKKMLFNNSAERLDAATIVSYACQAFVVATL